MTKKYTSDIFFILFFLVMFQLFLGCDLRMLGSERTGYKVILKAQTIGNQSIHDVETTLIHKNYDYLHYNTGTGAQREWKERHLDLGARFKNEISTGLIKTMTINGKKEIVQVILRYVPGPNYDAQNLMIEIENWWRGGLIPEIKSEIDEVEHSISTILAAGVGPGELHIQRLGKITQE